MMTVIKSFKLLSIISHDLRTPMYALRNLFRNVQKYDLPGDEIKLNENNFFTTRGTANESGTGLGLMLCKEFLANQLNLN